MLNCYVTDIRDDTLASGTVNIYPDPQQENDGTIAVGTVDVPPDGTLAVVTVHIHLDGNQAVSIVDIHPDGTQAVGS